MKKFFLIILVLAIQSLWTLDPVYHTNEEIIAELDSLQQIHYDIMQIHLLGLTATDEQPVYAVKISDNVEIDEDEPAVLFLGQCHAEEVIGVEISMRMIHDILTYRNINPYSAWINNIEIWIVPTHNPEGLQVVTDGWDTTYRKNKTDTNNNGIFDFIPGVGRDLDGVDLNRNYDFNWVHSDTLWTPTGNELYDYYRGEAPFSELEAQYIKQLADEQHFIYSIAWHSSRTGNLSEQVIFPWNWAESKPCVDLNFNTNMANTIAALIENETGSGNYEPSATIGRNSKAHDWFYNEYGTLQFEIEAGTSNLQPGPALLLDTINRCLPAPYFLMNRVLGYNASAAMLTGHITDAATSEPLQAEYIIDERSAPSFTPRFSDELYGRFWWQCSPGNYTLRIRKKGYIEHVQSVVVNNSMWTTRNVSLEPIPEANLSGSINFSHQDTELQIIARHEMGDEYFVFPAGSEDYQIQWWEGVTDFVFVADGYATGFISYDLTAGENIYDVYLEQEVILFSEDWSGDFSQWDIDGAWYIGIDDEYGINYAKDNPNRFYENSSQAYLQTGSLNLNGASHLNLQVSHKYHTEHGYDFCKIQITTDGITWHDLDSVSGVNNWQRNYYNLAGYENNFARLRFMLVTDASLYDPGWWLGSIKLVSATNVQTQIDEVAPITSLGKSYPNPFQISSQRSNDCRINFTLSQAGNTDLSIYNLKGQKVRSLIADYLEAGTHSISWDGKNARGEFAGSGVYFYKLNTQQKFLTQKLILIK